MVSFLQKIKQAGQSLMAFVFMIGLSLIVARIYFKAEFPYTHDGENHLARFANYKIALREGQFPPRWAPNLMNRYGYPVFNYNYPLANLLSLPFSILDIHYELTFKIIAGSFIVFGLWGLWRWLKKLQLKVDARLFGLSLFAFSPFLTNLIFFRGNIGELMAYGLFPWLLYLIEVARKRKLNLIEILLITAFSLAHNVTVFFAAPILCLYLLLRVGFNKKTWWRLLQAVLWAIALSFWFWLPAIAEKHLVNIGQVNLVTSFRRHFPTLRQLVFSPLSFGFSHPGPVDGLSFALGLGLIGSLFFGFLKIIVRFVTVQTKQVRCGLGFLSTLLLALLIIFQLPLTSFIWDKVPLVAFIQFPWRLSLFVASFGALLAALVWQKLHQGPRLILIFLLILQVGGQVRAKPADYFHRSQESYDAFTQTTTTQNENRTRSFTYQEIADWQPTAEILEGKGEVTTNYWHGSKRSYELLLDQTSTIVEPTMSFAGWETWLWLDGKEWQKVDYLDNDEIRGRIAYQLKPGSYQVTTRFTQQTWPRLVGNAISAIAILSWLFVFLKKIIGKKASFYLNLKLGLLLMAFSAAVLVSYQPAFPYGDVFLETSKLPSWLYSWANFDGVHYLTIVEKGYFGTGLIQAFFPLWPSLLSFANRLNLEIITFGLLVNFVFGWLLLKKWFKLLKFEFSKTIAWWGTLALFLFPSAFFFQALYNETLFLWLVISSFYAARNKNWWRAGIWAAFASATRVVGIMLLPALLIELIEQVGWSEFKQNFKDYWQKLAAVSLSAIGLSIYMLYLWQQFDDPLYFFHVQAEFGGGREEALILYPQVVWRYLKILTTNQIKSWRYLSYVQEFLAGTTGLAILVMSWLKVRRSYVVFSLLAFLLPTLTGTFSSLPRYILVCPAIFMILGQILTQKKWLRYLWLPISVGLLIINTMLFIQGWWVA